MTQEEKSLLLKDLSARLTYGVIVDYKEDEYDFHHWKISTLHAPAYSQSGSLINTDSNGWIEYNEYKGCGMSTGSRPLHLGKVLPYLRPMSSMTEEEFNEFEETFGFPFHAEFDMITKKTTVYNSIEIDRGYAVELDIDGVALMLDWLNKNMFDYRGLIEKGLAIEVTEENNPYKE